MIRNQFYRILTDDELLVLLPTDRLAEEEFYRRYKYRIRRMISKYKLNPIEREDFIQEGMIGLFHAIQTFDASRGVKFYTYAMTCLRNRILNFLDSHIRHQSRFDPNEPREDIPGTQNPEKDYLNSQLSDSLQKAFETLSPIEQAVAERYSMGKSYKIIAEELDISTKKVDNLLLKIKKKLSEQLDHLYPKND